MATRFLQTTSIMAVLALVVTACGGSPAASPAPSASTVASPSTASSPSGQPGTPSTTGSLAPLAPATITYEVELFPARQAIETKFIADFEAANPGVHVNVVIGAADDVQFLTKIVTEIAGGNGPDCYNLLSFMSGNLLRTGQLAPVDPAAYGAADQAALEATYMPGTLQGLEYQGKLYAVPTEVSNYDLFLNTAAFEKAGLSPASDAPKTWEDLIPLAKKLNVTKGGTLAHRVFDFQYGNADDPTSAALTLAGMAYQLGGTLLSADGTKAAINTGPWAQVFTFIQNWVTSGYGKPSLASSIVGFQDGSVDTTLSGSWYAGYLSDNKSPVAKTYAVAPLPRFANAVNNTGAFAYGYGTYVNAKSSPANQAACQRLVAALSSHPEVYLTTTGQLQPTNALLSSPTVKTIPGLSVFIADLKGTPWWPPLAQSTQLADVLTRALQRVTTNGQGVQAALDQAESEANALLAKQ